MTEQQQQPTPEKSAPQQSGKKTSTGLDENVASFLCYLGWWITGIIFLVLEKENKTVRFHAIQSICVFAVFWIIALIFVWVPFLNFILWIIVVIFWVIFMVRAYQGKKV